MTATAYLSLGSNLGDGRANLEEALRRLEARGAAVIQRSRIYRTEPVGVRVQPQFNNLACQVETGLDAAGLLALCEEIEREMGRSGKGDLGPRVIDLDLLFFGSSVISSPGLCVPHPRLYQRRFVLVPLEEIASSFVDPVTGKTVRTLLWECLDRSAVEPLAG